MKPVTRASSQTPASSQAPAIDPVNRRVMLLALGAIALTAGLFLAGGQYGLIPLAVSSAALPAGALVTGLFLLVTGLFLSVYLYRTCCKKQPQFQNETTSKQVASRTSSQLSSSSSQQAPSIVLSPQVSSKSRDEFLAQLPEWLSSRLKEKNIPHVNLPNKAVSIENDFTSIKSMCLFTAGPTCGIFIPFHVENKELDPKYNPSSDLYKELDKTNKSYKQLPTSQDCTIPVIIWKIRPNTDYWILSSGKQLIRHKNELFDSFNIFAENRFDGYLGKSDDLDPNTIKTYSETERQDDIDKEANLSAPWSIHWILLRTLTAGTFSIREWKVHSLARFFNTPSVGEWQVSLDKSSPTPSPKEPSGRFLDGFWASLR